MKLRNSYRIPLGFLFGTMYIWRANPSVTSFFIGAAIMMFGECIRFLGAGTLMRYKKITVTGVYSYTRNPLYIGSFFIGIGACIMGRDMIFTVLFLVVYLLVYSKVIQREERYLAICYGEDYKHYLQEIPRIFPRRFNLQRALSEMKLSMALRNGEHLTVLGIIAVWIIIVVKTIALDR